jgi:hypothetical protein
VSPARLCALLTLGVATVVLLVGGSTTAGAQTSAAGSGRGTLIVDVQEASFEQLLNLPVVRSIASHGGAGLVPRSTMIPGLVTGGEAPGPYQTQILDLVSEGADEVNRRLAQLVSPFPASRLLVIVTSTRLSAAQVRERDDLAPVVVAVGAPSELAATPSGPLGSLTSDSTRRDGVVTGGDLAVTAFDFGVTDSGTSRSDIGEPIQMIDGPPPFELHERYLAMRRMTVPIQTAAALYVTIAGLFCIAVVALGRRVATPIAVIATGAAISVGPLAAALLAAGHLPSFSYATVVPFVVLVTLVVTGIVVLGSTVDLIHPLYPLGVVLLAYLVVEAILGWSAALTPFLGGSELDGGRFYGLPNVFIGLVLGASLFVAQRLTPRAGFVVLVAAALFAGLPYVGANLGGAITLFAAAGVWLPLRARGRLRWAEIAFAVVVVVVGTAVVLIAHRLAPLPTHITNFEEHGGGLGGAWRTFVERLGVGVRLIEHNPFSLVPVVGVIATLVIVLFPPAVIAPSLERHRAWRDALLVILLASVVAYLVNDSGPAACGVGFGMALGGLMYVSVAERTWKMASA